MTPAIWTETIQNNVAGGADAARLLVFALDILPRVVDLAATSIKNGDDEGAMPVDLSCWLIIVATLR